MKLRIQPGDGMSTHGTKVFLDDIEITQVTSITLEARTNDVWRATLRLNVIVEGLSVDATTIADEVRVYRVASRWELLKAMLRPRQ